MKLQLSRPLIVFDLETTGVNLATDRIVEISYYKLFPDGHHEAQTLRIKPMMKTLEGKEVQMPIPQEASAIHGIYDADVADCPTFKQVAPALKQTFADADLAGYNSTRFDIPLLAEEFLRAGVSIDMQHRHFVDAFTIFQQHEPRTLSAAYKFYCHKNLEDAHSANADTRATVEVLAEQLERYEDLPHTVEALSDKLQNGVRFADLAGRIAYDKDGKEFFTFGKYKGQSVAQVFRRDGGYYNWLLSIDLPQYTKQVFTRIFLDRNK